MTSIAANLQAVRLRVAAACGVAGRPVDSVQLLAVSKTWPADSVREAAAAGQRAFGESYAQEAVDKALELAELNLEWHFIGPMQSNKTRLVAENFGWVHSVDRLKIAERLAEQRPSGLAPLQFCIQVNVSGEASKSGCAADEALALGHAAAVLPNLRLRGLMAIPEPSDDSDLQRRRFAVLRQLRDRFAAEGLPVDTLSMGMSHDLEAAIMEGSTLVRVGTAIFGERRLA
ncbi:MAG: YggS family pyridoxal phosphate-dependent enzyme [Burkholderiaceae bacterium]|nr:YggS family pyridoxal phosphate-dependent enzyme [Sulfuritalea sp.]MCF8174794.1 YggS family pyridoxal phosphate-dependent enzyme [Burkholderiaceae bacterium]